ncbi:Zinc finger and BTB domain-containing protein 41 [Triplophysa tibetana]|uniref:Zinc finger and BTB domain-containing protein 41 n=1 Tax=Triplophysa tibetana TaxID=1572043 RepID=A0A5A9PAD2_9TELE|nr:Zinc finger and BTB domain-containing protein 41 [Triplophysa tibetana]
MKRKLNIPQLSKVKDVSSTKTQETITSAGLEECDADQTIKDSSQEIRHLKISQSDNSFFKFLNDDRQKLPSFCDITITVCGKTYHAHKVVLAFGSHYFHARFTENPDIHHVTIDNINGWTFRHLLNFLYTSEFKVLQNQIPALGDAACFLDMMEAVNLLTKWAAPAHAPEESYAQQVPQKTTDVQDVHSSAGAQCSFCSRSFCYRKSLENHLAKRHSAGCHGEEEQTEVNISVVNTRRSARQRRTPAKFEIAESENWNKTRKAKTQKDDAASFEEEGDDDDDDDESEEEQQNEQGEQNSKEVREALHGEEAECEDATEKHQEDVTEHCMAVNQVEAQKEPGPDTNHPVAKPSQVTETSSHVFPDGLAPIMVQSTNKKTLKCPKCDKTFDRIGKYESHTRVHTGEKPFQCDICLQCYSTKSNLTVHKKKHESNLPIQKKDHQCPFCNKLHASRKTLGRHVKRFHPDHLQEFLTQKKKKSEGWKCDVCHKSFTRRPHLEEHMILHSQDKPFKCAYCDEYFKSRFARLKHQEKIHLGPFPCDICGRQFNDRGNRKRHIECTHGGKRKWTCYLCGKSVRERYKAVVHQCQVCKKEFKGKTNLMSHFRTHSGEKPHRCVICNQTFRIKKTLTKHLVIHSDVRPFSCPHCSATFKRKDKLKYHVDHVHSTRLLDQQQLNLPTAPPSKLAEALPPNETPKAYHNTPKTVLQSVSADVCVPVTLVPVQMTDEADLAVHGVPHGVLPAVSQQQQTGYQSTTDLVFLEKYTLTPQPTNIVHPVRPDQMLDPREQSYLGTLLGLDSSTSVQNMTSAEHTH